MSLTLKDEGGNTLTIPCQVNNNPDDLQDLPVYIRGAETELGHGKIIIPCYQTMGGQHIMIENFSSDDLCKEGDSGALVQGRAFGNQVQIWAIGTIIGKFMCRKEESGGNMSEPLFLAVGLSAGLADLSRDDLNAFELATQKTK